MIIELDPLTQKAIVDTHFVSKKVGFQPPATKPMFNASFGGIKFTFLKRMNKAS